MLAFFVVLLIVVAALEWASVYDPLSRLSYDVRALSRSVDRDEPFVIESTIGNGSMLPVPFLRVQENLPPQIRLAPESAARYAQQNAFDSARAQTVLTSTVSLWPRQKLVRRVTASLPARGRYFLRGATLTGGDFLGLSETSAPYPAFSEIVVLPARAESAPELAALGGFLGDVSVRRFIMEDPVLTLGFRDYTGREPQKQIAWTKSLAKGSLVVREYDHTLEPTVTVLLNVSCAGAERAERVERCFSLSRTVCETLEKRRVQYGFLTNAMAAGALGLWSSVTEGLGQAHLYAILEGLGRATLDPAEKFERTLERALRMAEHGRSHILITPDEDADTIKAAKRLSALVGGPLLILAASSAGNGEG